MSSTGRALWFVISVLFLATAIFVPIRIKYRQNEKPTEVPAGAVVIANYEFVPESTTIDGSTMVAFQNTDGAAHTATADDGSFDTTPIAAGQTIKVMVIKTTTYHCDIHPSMKATIELKG